MNDPRWWIVCAEVGGRFRWKFTYVPPGVHSQSDYWSLTVGNLSTSLDFDVTEDQVREIAQQLVREQLDG